MIVGARVWRGDDGRIRGRVTRAPWYRWWSPTHEIEVEATDEIGSAWVSLPSRGAVEPAVRRAAWYAALELRRRESERSAGDWRPLARLPRARLVQGAGS